MNFCGSRVCAFTAAVFPGGAVAQHDAPDATEAGSKHIWRGSNYNGSSYYHSPTAKHEK